jgi:hypothetical protein
MLLVRPCAAALLAVLAVTHAAKIRVAVRSTLGDVLVPVDVAASVSDLRASVQM